MFLSQPELSSQNRKTSHKDGKIGWDWIIYELMLVMDVDSFLCKNAGVADYVFLAFMKCTTVSLISESNVKWIANESLQENWKSLIATVPLRKESIIQRNLQDTSDISSHRGRISIISQTWDQG